MGYKIFAITPFLKEAKRLVKKYPSLKKELSELENQLSENPNIGTPLGRNCFKIRIPIASKGKGKSGGGRIISHVYLTTNSVFLLAIYDKSEVSTLSTDFISERLKHIKQP